MDRGLARLHELAQDRVSRLVLGCLGLGLVQLLLQRLRLGLELLLHVLPELGSQTFLLDLGGGAATLLADGEQVRGDSFLSYTTVRVSQP